MDAQRKCCFCCQLRIGCLTIGLLRLFLWMLILAAGFFTAIHIFSPDNQGVFHYRARINIQRNSYVVFMMIVVSLAGVTLEPLMMCGVIQMRANYLRPWYVLTAFSLITSMLLAVSFVLQNMDLLRVGDTWFGDAMCVSADILFNFVPEYLFGPRLVPMLIALLIMGHVALPLFHAFSLYVVRAFHKVYICQPEIGALAAARRHQQSQPQPHPQPHPEAGTCSLKAPAAHQLARANGVAELNGTSARPKVCHRCRVSYEMCAQPLETRC